MCLFPYMGGGVKANDARLFLKSYPLKINNTKQIKLQQIKTIFDCAALSVKEHARPFLDCDGVFQIAIGHGTAIIFNHLEYTQENQHITQLLADEKAFEMAKSDSYIQFLFAIQGCLPKPEPDYFIF
ncbi:MAG: hypothetical protein E6Q95_01100 [Chitinophagaceae bacterium]|nr:MAG: hypothetical protein E6Q95_01100 [Chitinophagaceae bacterium]